MRKFSIILSFALMFAALGLATPAGAQWPQTTDHNPWSLEIGGKAYNRPGSKLDIPLITDSITRETVFNAGDATELGSTAAAEIKFDFNSKTGQDWQIRSILANWEESSDPILGPNLESPFFPTGIVPDQFNYDYDSSLFSVELMGRRAVRPGIVLMFGPRVVSTKDTVFQRSRLVVNPGGGVPPITVTSESITEATNILMGLQSGLELNRPVANGIYASSFIRAGGYYNPTEVNFTDNSSFSPTVSNTLTKSTGSFLGEVGGRVYMDIVPNCFSGYVGYEANWIDGIALAPPQLLQPVSPTPSIETANTVFFHGLTFGLKFTY